MALEPITRQEQIIAGKDLQPVTRMEFFLKAYGGGGSGGSGGGSGGAFVVTITKDGGTGAYSADKTFEEISAAIEAGQNCVFRIIVGTIRNFVTLKNYAPGNFIELNVIGIRPSDFSHPEILDCLDYELIACMADNTWQNNLMTYKLTILE